jgi:hypothetical protein
MACVTYGCDPIEDYEVNICGSVIKGGQSAGLLFTCDSDLADLTDLTDNAAINAAVAADIAAGKAVKVEEVNWTGDAGSPVQFGTQTVAARPNGQITTDYTDTIIDANVNTQNDAFWDVAAASSGRVWGGYIMHHTQSPAYAHYMKPDNGLYVQVTKPRPADTDPVHYAATLVYKSVGIHKLIDAPTVFTV